jgi:hypothetical protein
MLFLIAGQHRGHVRQFRRPRREPGVTLAQQLHRIQPRDLIRLQDSILALRLMTGAMGCVSWLTIDLNPHLFLTDVLSGLSVCAVRELCSCLHVTRRAVMVTNSWRWMMAAAVAQSLSVLPSIWWRS